MQLKIDPQVERKVEPVKRGSSLNNQQFCLETVFLLSYVEQ